MNRAELFTKLAEAASLHKKEMVGKGTADKDPLLQSIFERLELPYLPRLVAVVYNEVPKAEHQATIEYAWLAYRTLFYEHLLPIARKVFPAEFGGGTKNLTTELRAEANEEGAAVLELLQSFQQLQLMMLQEGIVL